jgi:lipopolysaccharide/colanic/teichoic acid biosynthesis glycosyltransferase
MTPAPALNRRGAPERFGAALHVAPPELEGKRGYRVCKRAFDIVVAGGLLLFTLPIWLLAALAVKATTPGPVLYRARRAGLCGRPFAMLKFRTMRVATDTADRKITDARDDRITPVGALLRKTKVDELPQLWNVLRGEMSIVGPRPEDHDFVLQHYTKDHMRSLATRPGIACTAEVRWYPDLTFHDPAPTGVSTQDHYLSRHMPAQVAEGVRYVEQQSLGLDCKVLFQTAACVLFRSWVPPRKRAVSLLPQGEDGQEVHT